MSKARVIGRNISFIVLSRIVTMTVSFALFPFIVGHVGKEVYGVYLIVMSVTGYFGLLDFGVTSALTKYVSEYHGKGDFNGINRIINASFSFYVIIGAIISFLLFLSSVYFTRFFKVDPSNIEVMRNLFIVASLSSLFVWPLSTFRGTIQGLNMWGADVAVNISNQVLLAAATFFMLTRGYGIVQLFIAMQVLTVVGNLVLYGVARGRIGLRILFPYTEFATFKFISNFSFFMFLSSLIAIFLYQVHNIIIGYFISMSAVSVYAVAYNLQNYFRVINSTIGGPSWIVASEMEGAYDYERQKQLLFKGTKFMSAVFLPLIIIVFVFAKPFINYWMGPSFRESILPARIIILFWLFTGTSELATGLLSAKGVVRRPLIILLATAVLNLLISILFIKPLGIIAVALGLAVSTIFVAFPLYLRLSLRTLNVTFKEYFDKSIKLNLILYLVVAVLATVVVMFLYPKNFLFTLFEMAVIYGISLSLYYFKLLNSSEKEDVKRVIGFDSIYQRIILVRDIFS